MATKGVELASAYISLSISVDDVPKQVEKALKGSSKTAEKAGKDIGRKISSGASSGISDGQMAKALARELGSAGDKGSKQILKSLAATHRQAEKDASVAGRNYAKAMALAMTTGGSKDAAHKFEAEFRKALSAKNASQPFFDEFHRDGIRRGKQVGALVGKAVGGAITLAIGAATAGATAAVGGIGFTLFKGFERYKSLDATSKRLQAMGKTGEQVKTIMGDITKVVEGTPIALDEAAGAATKFLQGNVKEGKELNDIMTAIADAAGASGQNFGDLATIFGQVMNKGKLQAEEMNQLNERGINIQAALRDEFGWTADELVKMSDEGTITFGNLVQAVEGKFGGMAKKMGDTIDGALGNMQTAVARVGANFISAIFGDPLDTTQGPGGMAQAINNVTTKLDGVNQWVVGHQGDIKQFFTDAAETAKDVATAVKNVGSFLNEHKEIIVASATVWAGWKAISAVAGLVTSLQTVSSLLKVTLPASAATGAAGMTAALGPVAALVASIVAVTGGSPQDYVGGGSKSPKSAADDMDWGRVLFGDAANWPGEVRDMFSGDQPPSIPGGGGPGAQADRRGVPQPTNPLDVFAPTGGGRSPREFAHQTMMPYWQKQGFTVGDHEADQYGEHQNGALDIMIPNLEAGQRVLSQVLQDPNVYGAIFNGQSYGYGRGMTPQPYTGPNPHTDHVHVWYKPQGMASGGAATGPGGPKSDSIPAYLSNGEHVLTANDVATMGGQGGVYAFRNALHRSGGGSIQWMDFIKQASPRGSDRHGGSDAGVSVGPFAPWWDMDWMPPEHPERIGPGNGRWWRRGPTRGGSGGKWGPPIGRDRKPLPGELFGPDSRIKMWGFAEGGAVTPEQLLQMAIAQGVDPATLLHGQGQGMPPGPIPGMEAGLPDPAGDRTEGYIPAGAGFSGKTGGGLAGGLIDMGAEAIKGVIQGAADMGKMAASIGMMGAGAPGGGAGAGAGIQVGADIAKRGVQWGADMLGIGIGAVTEILSPFGAPRWLSDVDPTAFMPQWNPVQTATTTGEKTNLAMQPPTPVDPMTPQHGTGQGQPPGPGMPGAPVQPGQFPGSGAPGLTADLNQPPPGQALNSAPPPAAPDMSDPMSWLKMFGFSGGGAVFDTGGVMPPKSVGLNLSNSPEYVSTQSQWKAMEANASGGVGSSKSGATYNVYAQDVDGAIRELRKNERRNARTYMVRP